MNFIKILFLLSVFTWCGCLFVSAQDSKNTLDKTAFDLQLEKIILKDFYNDPLEKLKVVFTFRVDSLGEVHSAHIRWNENLKCEEYYTICSQIEEKINLKFIYEKYKSDFEGEKYVLCRYPFFSEK